MAVKLDKHKAYEKLEWPFIRGTLNLVLVRDGWIMWWHAWVKERVAKKLEGWKERLLSHADKQVLKAIVPSNPLYVMSIVRLPKPLFDKLASTVSNFLWNPLRKDRSTHWVSLSELVKSKRVGGMGFRDFNCMNTTFLVKWAWRLAQESRMHYGHVSWRVYIFQIVISRKLKNQGTHLATSIILLLEETLLENTDLGG